MEVSELTERYIETPEQRRAGLARARQELKEREQAENAQRRQELQDRERMEKAKRDREAKREKERKEKERRQQALAKQLTTERGRKGMIERIAERNSAADEIEFFTTRLCEDENLRNLTAQIATRYEGEATTLLNQLSRSSLVGSADPDAIEYLANERKRAEKIGRAAGMLRTVLWSPSGISGMGF